MGRLPFSWGEALGAHLGRLAYRFGWRTRVVESQLALAFPGRDEVWIKKTARASFEHLGREAAAMASLPWSGTSAVRERVEFDESREELAAALGEGRGLVIVSGHFANWELAGATLAAHGYPIDAVMQRLKNRRLDRYIQESRARLGMRLVDRAGAWGRLIEYLKAGRIVAFVADQDAGRSGVFVPFFGRLASTHRAPALLAVRGEAPFFVGGVRKIGPRRYRSWAARLEPRGDSVDGRVADLTRRWTAELERQIRLSPEQYFWHHRRWKTRPPGTDS